MLVHHPFETLGAADHGWLQAKHHFSFGGYQDAARMSHGELLVINDDRIAPQQGFAPHGHENMEIITYVRQGAISHEDNQGNKGRTEAGNVQVMSAGSGIFHAEYNFEDEDTTLYQIWIAPKSNGITPCWDAAEFPAEPVSDHLRLLVAGDDSAPLQINQDARIYAGRLNAGTALTHKPSGKAYVLVSYGAIKLNDIEAAAGDGIAVSDEAALDITAQADCEIVIIEVPGLTDAR